MNTPEQTTEDKLLECWCIVNDIQNLYHNIETMSEDDVMNYLLGLVTIYNVKFKKLHNATIKKVQ